jgi:regulator of protease activity HflC (stomatin/prohibitin superfamily)
MAYNENLGFDPVKVIRNIGLAILGIFLLIAFFNIFYTVNAGERAVLLTFGKPTMTAIDEGLHVKIPFVQSARIMDVKTQKYEAELSAASRDLQDVKTKIAINYHLIPESVPEIYQLIGISYAEKVIYPLEQETNKMATAQYTAEELITKRDEVREKMKTNLKDKLQPRGIVVEEISIINFDFSPSFTQAIEQKVTAEQNALTAKNKLAQVEYEAKQRVTQAEAEAEAIRIQAQAIQSQGGKDYVQLQAITKWDGKLPTIVTTGVVPFIDIENK